MGKFMKVGEAICSECGKKMEHFEGYWHCGYCRKNFFDSDEAMLKAAETMDVEDKIMSGYYEYTKVKRKTSEECKKEAEEIVFAERAKNTVKVIQSVNEMEKIKKEIDEKAKEIKIKNYHACSDEKSEKMEEFKMDIEKENWISGHPKRDLLFRLIKSEVSPGNLMDFMNSYNEFAELLRK